ncbi:MAG: serine hydrolase domain-containing protein [Pseudomonadota bacterium]
MAPFLMLLAVSACESDTMPRPIIGPRIDRLVPEFIREARVAGVGIAVIRSGELVWSGFYGEQGPGTEVGTQTAFNTASVAKSITAETLIALERQGLIDFDELPNAVASSYASRTTNPKSRRMLSVPVV